MMTTRPWWRQLQGTNLTIEYNFQTEAQMSLKQPQQFIHITCVIARSKRDGTGAETRFGLSAKRTSLFKLAGKGGGRFGL